MFLYLVHINQLTVEVAVFWVTKGKNQELSYKQSWES